VGLLDWALEREPEDAADRHCKKVFGNFVEMIAWIVLIGRAKG
jgi:hypothetical protein